MQIGVDSSRSVENRRVFVIDPDEIVSAGLQFMLADELETHVFFASAAAIGQATRTPPELIIIGSDLLAVEGAGITKTLRERLPAARLLVVCFDAEEALVKAALALGANGTLLRPLRLEAVRRKVDLQLGRRAALKIPVVVR
ncbi:response regulator [Niveibacterium sp. SC-1]|uniref:response regulator n=1 Tax=Niveibacterium sp. SC-1 TaxID=3135646 RepID=UPI00311EA6A4